jgi:hypothetical protein
MNNPTNNKGNREMNTVFENNQIIMREGEDVLIGFLRNGEVDFVNMDGYTIIPNEQYQDLLDRLKQWGSVSPVNRDCRAIGK